MALRRGLMRLASSSASAPFQTASCGSHPISRKVRDYSSGQESQKKEAPSKDGQSTGRKTQDGIWNLFHEWFKEIQSRFWGNNLHERLTFLKSIKGNEMEPTFATEGETLLVRKIPSPSFRSVFIGDVVLFKDPLDPEQERIRRVAAMEGDQMVSTDANDLPFALDDGHCWVISDNGSINPTTSGDSRTFGQLPLENIVGRVIYACRSSDDHGRVMNSEEAMQDDQPVLAIELDLDELSQNVKN